MPKETEVRKTNEFMIWCLLAAAVITDAKYYKIPNQLIGLGYITGLFLNLNTYGLLGIKFFCFNAIWPVVLLYLLFLLKGLGSGDIKLFSVMATMVGAIATYETMVISIFLAGSVAVILCLKEKKIVKRKLHYSFYITAGFYCLKLWEELIR